MNSQRKRALWDVRVAAFFTKPTIPASHAAAQTNCAPTTHRVSVSVATGAASVRRRSPCAFSVGASISRWRWCWRGWWREQFPRCAFWQAACARFMPPLAIGALPASLLERFGGALAEPMMRLLVFLSPITVCRPITLQEAR